jgi:pyruvate dehydrogenase E1 component alpha subunit
MTSVTKTMDALELYRWMVISRQLEQSLCHKIPRWFPAEGEEGVIVGSFCELKKGDVAAPHYRGPFVVYLMQGADLKRLVCQALGKVGGYNKGRSVPFTGPGDLKLIPWVAGDLGTTIGTATGAALGLQQEGKRGVCICSFGDGTANRGDFHENINTAALWKLPIVYVCQNNGWAISQNVKTYLPAPIVDRASGYGIPGEVVNGNDVEAVKAAVRKAVDRARNGEGPSLIEARTWRKKGHWAKDKAFYQSASDCPSAMRDPVADLGERLLEKGRLTQGGLDRIHNEAQETIASALQYAESQADAGCSELGIHEVWA